MDSLGGGGEPWFLEKRRQIENWRGNKKGKGVEGGTGIKGLGPGAWEWGQGYKTQVKSRENLGGKGKSRLMGLFIYPNG